MVPQKLENMKKSRVTLGVLNRSLFLSDLSAQTHLQTPPYQCGISILYGAASADADKLIPPVLSGWNCIGMAR